MAEKNTGRPENKMLERLRALQEKRQEVLRLPAQEALERILQDPQPAALVHSFPDADFYFLVHELGPEDSLELFKLASDRQWDHLLDMEAWHHDRLDVAAAGRWMNLLLSADPKRFVRWALRERLAFLELYLFRNIEVRVRQHDQDPSEFGDDFFSLDGTYYIRFLDLPAPEEPVTIDEEQRQAFVERLLNQLADHHHPTFQGLLLETAHLIPAEVEEEALHWRQVRLAEKGLLPFEEAVGIYQPLTPEALRRRGRRPATEGGTDARLPVPVFFFRELPGESLFARSLREVADPVELERLQLEFAHLCNRIIVADRRTVREREELKAVVEKACGYLGIGLERLLPAGQPPQPAQAAPLLVRYHLADLFRVGFGLAMALKWRVERWLSGCWFAAAGLRLTFWGERGMGVLGGLLIKKPLYYDNYRSGSLYREFAASAEIAECEAVFERIKALDALLSLLPMRIQRAEGRGLLTYKNLLLTLWARHALGLEADRPAPLSLEEFRPFFERLLPPDAPASSDGGRRVPEEMKRDFLAWLSEATGLENLEVSRRLGEALDEIFSEIEAELGRVSPERLDARFVNLFRLAGPSEASPPEADDS